VSNDRLYEYRKLCVAAEQKAQDDFDKSVLALSGGALGVSFAFIKDIVGPGAIIHPYLLVSAWAAWGASIVATLASYWFGQQALRTAIDQVDVTLRKRKGAEGQKGTEGQKGIDGEIPGRKFAWITAALNVMAGLLFVLGVASIVTFVGANVGGIHSAGARPTGTSRSEADVRKVLSVGPFADADTTLAAGSWDAVEHSVTDVLSRQQPPVTVQSILLLGGVDRRSLSPSAKRHFSSNTALALARAEAVRARLIGHVGDSIVVSIIPLGALELSSATQDSDLGRDRRVDVYLVSRPTTPANR
jgi:hypothetical protein